MDNEVVKVDCLSTFRAIGTLVTNGVNDVDSFSRFGGVRRSLDVAKEDFFVFKANLLDEAGEEDIAAEEDATFFSRETRLPRAITDINEPISYLNDKCLVPR